MPNTDTHEANAGQASVPLSEFLGSIEHLDRQERAIVVEQALLLMEQVYVHLPLKRAMHAVDPVQRLRLLRHRLDLTSHRAFHEELIATFMSVRDLHTNYMLPDPYRRAVAFLPFEVREFYHQDQPVYIVSAVMDDLRDASFKPGVRVTHWNGMPIARAIELNARRNAGSNAAANHVRGLDQMTFRPLMMSLPPDEEWVDLRYLDAVGTAHEKRFMWNVLVQGPFGMEAQAPVALTDPTQKWRLAQGIDVQTDALNATRKMLLDHAQVEIEEEVLRYLQNPTFAAGDGPDFSKVSRMPNVFQFSVKQTSHGERGYIRIATFAVPDPQAFVREFIRILSLLPQEGLILDVRGNGGGNINAGEMLLQTLTDERIEPERFHFISSPLMARLVTGTPEWFAAWERSMGYGLLTGAPYSQGLPLTEPDACNAFGRKYPGKVVLLIDARCYSTTDIFAAGFQDHRIGSVIGNHACTGAGGANVFDWGLLIQLFDRFSTSHEVQRLARGAGLRAAIRGATRVRDNAGWPLEDLGVQPDIVHRTTLADLVEGDRDLLERAASLTR